LLSFCRKYFCLDINKYIKELIIRNECIILSGFGGFETHYKPAFLDSTTGKMIPPSKQVIFRPDFKNDNKVLVRYVAVKEGISQDKAEEIIEDFIGNIVFKIDVGGIYVLDGLGKFLKQPDGRLIFIPFEEENFLIDSFGLSEISIPDKEKTAERAVVEDQTVIAPAVKHSNRILYLIAIMVVILSGIIILIVKFDLPRKVEHLISGSETRNKKTPEKIVFGQKRESTYEDSIDVALSNRIDVSTEKKKALYYKEQEPVKEAKPEISGKIYSGGEKKYVIVAGSFQAEAYAVDLSNQLKYKGFRPAIIKTENGLYRVVLDSFEEINAAIDELEKYKKLLNKEIWILRI
jgi:nucleoid DNA-binding protein/cell division septation protein DedD